MATITVNQKKKFERAYSGNQKVMFLRDVSSFQSSLIVWNAAESILP